MKYSCRTSIFVTLFSIIRVSLSCVVIPSEIVSVVGDRSSISCNARPNNETKGTITNVKLGSEGATGTLIFQRPDYNARGQIITEQFVAQGYFLSDFDDDLANITIQINRTLLSHAGTYFCSCYGTPTPLGRSSLVVLEPNPTFGINEGRRPTAGAIADLNCSVSFNGSAPTASVDLSISDAAGKELVTRTNQVLTLNTSGGHHANFRVIADPNEDQRFTCVMKIWKKTSIGQKQPFRTSTVNFSLSWEPVSGVKIIAVSSCSKECLLGDRLQCVAEGNPKPNIEWYKSNGRDVPSQPTGNGSEYLTLDEPGQITFECRAFNTIRNRTSDGRSEKLTIKVTVNSSKAPLVVAMSVSAGILVLLLATTLIFCWKKSFCRSNRTGTYNSVQRKDFNLGHYQSPEHSGNSAFNQEDMANSNHETVVSENDMYVTSPGINRPIATPANKTGMYTSVQRKDLILKQLQSPAHSGSSDEPKAEQIYSEIM